MNPIAEFILEKSFGPLLTLVIVPLIISIYWIAIRKSKIRKWRNILELKNIDSSLELYLSSHKVMISKNCIDANIPNIQPYCGGSFDEHIEVQRFIDSLRQPRVNLMMRIIFRNRKRDLNIVGKSSIVTNILPCPEHGTLMENNLSELLSNGDEDKSIVLIGGPRSNLLVRKIMREHSKELPYKIIMKKNEEKETIIKRSEETRMTVDEKHNFGIIQKFTFETDNGKRIHMFFLCGTGLNGTLCSIAHFRKSIKTWIKNKDMLKNGVILKCKRRENSKNVNIVSSKELIEGEDYKLWGSKPRIKRSLFNFFLKPITG